MAAPGHSPPRPETGGASTGVLQPTAMATEKMDTPRSSNASARILDAADELLVEAGYDGVSIRAVAERAGVTKGLVFYHFGTKRALVERVLERYYEDHLQALKGAFDSATQPELSTRLHSVVDSYLDFIEENIRYPRFVQQQLAGADTFHDLIRRNLEPLFRWTEGALGDVAPSKGPQSIRQFFVTFSAVAMHYYTYAPILRSVWGEDPMGPAALAERRAHVHWLVEIMIRDMVPSPGDPATGAGG